MTPIPPVAMTLSERIADELRGQLTQGHYAPGQRLSEQALSEALGISRNTLREVFRLLAKEGLVKHSPNRGVFVAVPSIASIIDIYRVRRLIECQALAQAYPLHPAMKKMRQAVEAAVAARDQRDWTGVGTANMAFHSAIVQLADSERLGLLFASVLAELRLAFGMMHDPEFLHAPYVDMNVTILQHAEAHDFAKAAASLAEYLVHSERIVLAVYGSNDNLSAQRRSKGA